MVCTLCLKDEQRIAWEYEDFFAHFTTLFGRKIGTKRIWNWESFEDVIENGTVLEVMEAATYLFDKRLQHKGSRTKFYNMMVEFRELYHSWPQPKDNQVLTVASDTPWRYVHDFLRREEFANYEWRLVEPRKASYFILGPIIGPKHQRFGIVDLREEYVECECDPDELYILCCHCNGRVINRQCRRDLNHTFSINHVRCFQRQHGRMLQTVREPSIYDPEFVTESVDRPQHFNRRTSDRKSQRKPKSPVSPKPPPYDEVQQRRSRSVTPDSAIIDVQPAQRRPQPQLPRPPAHLHPSKRPVPIIPPRTQVREPAPAEFPDQVLPTPTREHPYSPISTPPPDSPVHQEIPSFPPLTPITPTRTERPIHPPPAAPSPPKELDIPEYRIPGPPVPPHYRLPRLTDASPLPQYELPPSNLPPRYDFPVSPKPPSPTPIPIQPSLPHKHDSFTVLLIGPSGAGKSTWVNGLANYLKFDSLAEAKRDDFATVIPTRFDILDDQFNCYTIEHGHPDSNERYVPGESVTQLPKVHRMQLPNATVHLIDTPGVADTRGLVQDELNCRAIVQELQNMRENQLHAICIVLKANESRMTTNFYNAVYALLGMFPRSAVDNFVFIFTYSRGSCFRVGDTMPVINNFFSELERNHGARFEIDRNRIFCVDNEAYRYLAVCAKRNPEYERMCLAQDDYDYAWRESQASSKRFLEFLKTVAPFNILEVIFYNKIKEVAEELARILLREQYVQRGIIDAYAVVIDWLLQEGIVKVDYLMRDILRNNINTYPAHVNPLLMDNRQLPARPISLEKLINEISQVTEYTIITEHIKTTIEYIVEIERIIRVNKRSSTQSNYYSEIHNFSELPLHEEVVYQREESIVSRYEPVQRYSYAGGTGGGGNTVRHVREVTSEKIINLNKSIDSTVERHVYEQRYLHPLSTEVL